MSLPPPDVFTLSGGLQLAYRDLPTASDRTPVLCLHGLTRNSRDFEDLAPWLAQKRRVIVPDMRGRGYSDRDPDVGNYQVPTYVSDVLALLEHLGIPKVIVVGTSMGGLMGMGMAMARREVLAGLVLNDIGPALDPAGLARIASYVGKTGHQVSWEAAASAAAKVTGDAMPDFGPEDWLRFARRTFREDAPDRIVPDYDSGIAEAMRAVPPDALDLWSVFKSLSPLPVMVVWGVLSDLLTRPIVAQMRAAMPALAVVEVPNRGHAPTLDEPVVRRALDAWLGAIG